MGFDLFAYGEIVNGELFAGREREVQELEAYIKIGQTVIIYGYRRVGKSSLIKEAIERHKSKKAHKKDLVIFFDISKLANSEQFLAEITKSIVKLVESSKPLQAGFKRIASSLTALRPVAKINQFTGELEHSIEFTGPQENIANSIFEALSLLDELREKQRIIVIFDEVQEISKWQDGKQVEWQIRSKIQNQKNVSYIFSGSSRTLIEKMFMRSSSALYRSGALMHLEDKIEIEILITWIKERFSKAKMSIDGQALARILEISRAHPYYVQKLCQFTWLEKELGKTKNKSIGYEDVNKAISRILIKEKFVFDDRLARLSNNQKEVISSVANQYDPEKSLGLAQITKLTQISRSSVQSAIKSLLNSEDQILIKEKGSYKLEDPFFSLYLVI